LSKLLLFEESIINKKIVILSLERREIYASSCNMHLDWAHRLPATNNNSDRIFGANLAMELAPS